MESQASPAIDVVDEDEFPAIGFSFLNGRELSWLRAEGFVFGEGDGCE